MPHSLPTNGKEQTVSLSLDELSASLLGSSMEQIVRGMRQGIREELRAELMAEVKAEVARVATETFSSTWVRQMGSIVRAMESIKINVAAPNVSVPVSVEGPESPVVQVDVQPAEQTVVIERHGMRVVYDDEGNVIGTEPK